MAVATNHASSQQKVHGHDFHAKLLASVAVELQAASSIVKLPFLSGDKMSTAGSRYITITTLSNLL